MSKAKLSGGVKGPIVAIMIVLAALWAAPQARAERRGAEVSILKTDGTHLTGELIAVQGETLILLADGVDASVKLEEIGSLAVHRRSKALDWMVHGDVFGIKAVVQTGDDQAAADQELGQRVLSRDAGSTEAALNVLTALVGAVSDAKVSRDEVYLLKGIKTTSQKKEFLKHLNGLARVQSDTWVKK